MLFDLLPIDDKKQDESLRRLNFIAIVNTKKRERKKKEKAKKNNLRYKCRMSTLSKDKNNDRTKKKSIGRGAQDQ